MLAVIMAQSGADPTSTGTAIVAVLALIGLFGTFMKLTSDNRSDVNTVTASQIKQLNEDRKTAEANETAAYKARDEKQREVESWRERHDKLKDENNELRIRLAIAERANGTAPNDG